MSEYFYCEDCGLVFEVRNWNDVTGNEFIEEAQDVSCPHCRNAGCIHIPDFDTVLSIENDVWDVKRAERALREAERKLVEKASQISPAATPADGE